MSHTPGPWATEGFDKIDASTGNFYGGIIVGSNGEDIVAQCVLPHNAKLIAATPELLEALKEMIHLAEFWINREDRRDYSRGRWMMWHALGHGSNALLNAREAIAKAEGKNNG